MIQKIIKKISGKTYPYPLIQKKLFNFAPKLIPTFPLETKIDICMLTLNRLEDTKRTLNSLFRTTLNFNLIIIDQKSDDGTIEFLKKFVTNNKNCTLILENKNIGVSGGRAKAITLCKSNFLAFVDNDMVFAPGYFEHMLYLLEKNEEVGGVFAKVVLPTGKIEVNSPTLNETNKWLIFDDIDKEKQFFDKSTCILKECMWIPMGASMWKISVLKEVQIDTNLLGAYEDNDFTFRVSRSGYKLSNCPSSIVLHIKAQFTKHFRDSNYAKGRFDVSKLRNAIKQIYQKFGKYPAFGSKLGHSQYLEFNNIEEYINFLKS